MKLWSLPRQAQLGGKGYPFHADYRDILEIFEVFHSSDLPEFLRWQVALALFYEDPIPQELAQQAMEYLADFITAGSTDKPGPRLLDWQHDAPLIISDINRVAGQEVRSMPFVHWWTFLSWFHGIGQGRLSTVVALREKLRRGKKLEDWEREFYRSNKALVDLRPPERAEDLAEKARLEALLQRK